MLTSEHSFSALHIWAGLVFVSWAGAAANVHIMYSAELSQAAPLPTPALKSKNMLLLIKRPEKDLALPFPEQLLAPLAHWCRMTLLCLFFLNLQKKEQQQK